VIGPGAGVRGPNPTLPISEVRVIEDGVKPIKPEAKCDWPGAGEFELSVAAFADRA